MESDYNKKDLKSSPKVKVVEEGIIKKDGKLYKFIWKGYEHGFEKEIGPKGRSAKRSRNSSPNI